MDRDEFACRFCGDSVNTLHVHHLLYLPEKNPWVTLCSKCHSDEEKLKNQDKFLLGNLMLAGISRRDMYSLASELRRYLSDIETRNSRFQNLMLYLYEG